MRVQSRHSSRHKRLLRIALVALVVLIVGLIMPKAFSLVSATVMYPIHVTNVWLEESSSLIPTFFRSRADLQAEIEGLQNELAVAGRIDVTQQRLLEENNRLRHLFGSAEVTRILASIVARPSELPYDVLQVDRGSEHGVEIGAPVFVGSDVVVGLVVHVAPQYSFVELFTTPGFEATAFVSGPNVIATLEGFGGGVARVRVPQGVSMQVGNLVYLPSIEPGVFGRISHIENRPTQPEQYGYITPELPISSMFWVAIGKQSQLAQSTEQIDKEVESIMRKRLVNSAVSTAKISSSTQEFATSSEEMSEI